MYDVNLNYLEIISGTSNHIHPAYMEAAKDNDEYNSKGATALKSFLEDIEELASRDGAKDKRISESKGNIRNFQGYENIDKVLSFLRKHLGKIEGVSDCDKLFGSLERYIPQYEKGYDKQIRLIMLEYESAVYILVTSLAMFMATKMDFVADGEQIRIQKKNESTHGVIEKTLKGMADIISKSSHRDYLEDLCKASDEVASDKKVKEVKEYVDFTESVVSDSLILVDSICTNATRIFRAVGRTFTMLKKTMFGIIPLIRSCIYLKYKKKADHIQALELQAAFIDRNIEQLENRNNMDPAKKAQIIKKQKAAAEGARKRAAKLRAQLLDNEKEASVSMEEHNKDLKQPSKDTKNKSSKPKEEKDNKESKNNNDDGDLVLEWVQRAFPVEENNSDFFTKLH